MIAVAGAPVAVDATGTMTGADVAGAAMTAVAVAVAVAGIPAIRETTASGTLSMTGTMTGATATNALTGAEAAVADVAGIGMTATGGASSRAMSRRSRSIPTWMTMFRSDLGARRRKVDD